MALKLIIFDCDGVLFHSERANIAFFNEVLARIGEPPLDAAGERMATVMAGQQLMQALFGADPDRMQRARDAARALDYGPFFQWMEPVAELHQTLAALRASYRLAMASNRGVTVAQVMRRFELDRHLELGVGTLDVERPKPAPDMLLKCTEHFGLTPSEALYVGDSSSDYEAARAAGMEFVAVGTIEGAAATIRELRHLPSLLRQRFAVSDSADLIVAR